MSYKRTMKNYQLEREPRQMAPKGCCCKRSQCIKNYCDCYQSMVICSIHCKCIGCRNTEVRRAVDAPPVKTAVAAKRERAAALSAKAAAAAAKSGVNIHLRPAPGSASYVGQEFDGSMVIPAAAAPEILQLPEMDVGKLVTLPPPTTIAQRKKQQTEIPIASPKPTTVKEVNIIKPPITVALLERILVLANEAEGVGMNPVQVGKLILLEYARGLQDITDIYTANSD